MNVCDESVFNMNFAFFAFEKVKYNQALTNLPDENFIATFVHVKQQ